MATTPQIFAQYAVSANGAVLFNTQTIKLKMDGKDTDVETILGGWSGITPSPKKISIDVEGAIPAGADFDLDAFQKFQDSEILNLTVTSLGNGKSLSSSGFVRDPELDAGVGKQSTLKFSFMGGPATFS